MVFWWVQGGGCFVVVGCGGVGFVPCAEEEGWVGMGEGRGDVRFLAGWPSVRSYVVMFVSQYTHIYSHIHTYTRILYLYTSIYIKRMNETLPRSPARSPRGAAPATHGGPRTLLPPRRGASPVWLCGSNERREGKDGWGLGAMLCTHRHTDTQTDRQTDTRTQTHTHKHTHAHRYMTYTCRRERYSFRIDRNAPSCSPSRRGPAAPCPSLRSALAVSCR